MKKLLILVPFCLSMVFLNDPNGFPYSKMLNFNEAQLREAKFKRDANRNQWVLEKSNGLQATSNVLSVLAGTSTDTK